MRWTTVGWILHAMVFVATAFRPFTPGLGEPTWHHNASLGLVLIYGLVRWPRLRHRSFLGRGVMWTTLLALLSAFLLLYLKQDLKDWGLKDWGKFWHVAWSWWALLFFVMHTYVNWTGYRRAWARWHRRAVGWVSHEGLLLAVLVAVPLTWSAWGARTIVDGNYIPLTLYTWLAVVVPAYGAWAWQAIRPVAWLGAVSVQNFTTLFLMPATILANVSGFPILYFGTKDTSLKYVAKYWHTWPSIVMAVLVFAHTLHFWSGMRRYLDRQTAPSV